MIISASEFFELRNSKDPEKYFRAAHEEAPISVWRDVLNTYPEMAFWVAQNKTVPYEILEELASHPDARVRRMIASKNKLGVGLLMLLAGDSDESVRLHVARHRKATNDVLYQLINDPWSEISDLAKSRIASAE